jgi:predicted nucleic acid-binding protein
VNILLDTNILGRLLDVGHAQHRLASDATDAVRKRGDLPCIVPQVLYELWAVATRPVAANGLGLTASEMASEVSRLESLFPVLPDTADVFSEWKRLVTTHQVAGRNAHDARLVAAMTVHGLTHILTFNAGDFARYPGIVALEPAAVVPPHP